MQLVNTLILDNTHLQAAFLFLETFELEQIVAHVWPAASSTLFLLNGQLVRGGLPSPPQPECV